MQYRGILSLQVWIVCVAPITGLHINITDKAIRPDGVIVDGPHAANTSFGEQSATQELNTANGTLKNPPHHAAAPNVTVNDTPTFKKDAEKDIEALQNSEHDLSHIQEQQHSAILSAVAAVAHEAVAHPEQNVPHAPTVDDAALFGDAMKKAKEVQNYATAEVQKYAEREVQKAREAQLYAQRQSDKSKQALKDAELEKALAEKELKRGNEEMKKARAMELKAAEETHAAKAKFAEAEHLKKEASDDIKKAESVIEDERQETQARVDQAAQTEVDAMKKQQQAEELQKEARTAKREAEHAKRKVEKAKEEVELQQAAAAAQEQAAKALQKQVEDEKKKLTTAQDLANKQSKAADDEMNQARRESADAEKLAKVAEAEKQSHHYALMILRVACVVILVIVIGWFLLNRKLRGEGKSVAMRSVKSLLEKKDDADVAVERATVA